MDTDIEELKGEVEELKALTQDTNRIVHGMRRGQRWRTLFSVVWWVAIVAVSGATYYYYVQPYVEEIMKGYDNAKGFQVQVQDWFAQFGQKKAQ